MKLVDTDVLIEHLRGSTAATELLVEIADEAHVSVLTRFELLAGMRSSERHLVWALVDVIPNLGVTQEVSALAGEWARQYRRSHSSIGPLDYLIAATAEVHGADLLTRNVRHFPMFGGLEPAF